MPDRHVKNKESLFVHRQGFHESDIRNTTHFTFTQFRCSLSVPRPRPRKFLSSHYSKLDSALNTALRPQWTKFLSKDVEMHEEVILNRPVKLYDVISNSKLALNTSYNLC